jgi:hypothetical protein
MTEVFLYPYKTNSKGAELLSKALGIKRIKRKESEFKGSADRIVINWGCSELPVEIYKCRILNHPSFVSNVINKLYFFKYMTDAPDPPLVPLWTTSQTVAQIWSDLGMTVVVRNTLTGHGGDGIIIVTPKEVFPVKIAPLYTQYINKTHEFRVHVMKGKIFDYQEKVPAKDTEPKNWYIRNHDNGFKFVRGGITLPEDVRKQSLKAFVASGLDFCSADVVYDSKTGKAYILELNTASGLVGKTVDSYKTAFQEVLSGT